MKFPITIPALRDFTHRHKCFLTATRLYYRYPNSHTSWVTRADVRKILSEELYVPVYSREEGDGPWYMLRVSQGALLIGCCTFSAKTVGKIRKWANRKTR